MKKMFGLMQDVIGRLLSCVVPRDGRLCVAGSWMGEMYGDNPRYFVEYLLGHSDLRVVWVGKEHVRDKLPKYPHLKFARLGSLRAVCAASRPGQILSLRPRAVCGAGAAYAFRLIIPSSICSV